ncbi:hypothetical protein J6590_023100 [Homalodisca vitripennis]|nr:hypothetical protein J6590_023100 [Homalodisca vitripennis]
MRETSSSLYAGCAQKGVDGYKTRDVFVGVPIRLCVTCLLESFSAIGGISYDARFPESDCNSFQPSMKYLLLILFSFTRNDAIACGSPLTPSPKTHEAANVSHVASLRSNEMFRPINSQNCSFIRADCIFLFVVGGRYRVWDFAFKSIVTITIKLYSYHHPKRGAAGWKRHPSLFHMVSKDVAMLSCCCNFGEILTTV